MQDKFLNELGNSNHNGALIRNCIRQINYAKKQNNYIFIVEFNNFGPTIEKILNKIGNYKKVIKLIKFGQSGKEQINMAVNSLFKKKLIESNYPNLRFCGVYTDECVQSTVLDCKNYYKYKLMSSKIEVVKNACASYYDYKSHLFSIIEMKSNEVNII